MNFYQHEADVLADIPKLLIPVTKVVAKLSDSKANLLTADIEISRLINILESLKFDKPCPIRERFVQAIKERFTARRSITSNILQYLLSSKYPPSENIFCTEPTSMEIKKYFNNLCEISPEIVPENSDIKTSIIDTMDVDLAEFTKKTVRFSIDFEIEEFADSKKMGENLLRLAKVLLSIKPTSTDVERTFSTCGQVATKQRNRISTDLLNAIIVIKYYSAYNFLY